MNALLASHGSRSHSPGPGSPKARRDRAVIAFAIVALISFAVDGAIAHSSRFVARPELFTPAISFDLTLGVTIAYWLIVVRRGHAAMRTLVPAFVLSVGAATLTLPAGHRDLVHYARFLAVPFELAIFVAIVIAVRNAKRRLAAAGTELDVPSEFARCFKTHCFRRASPTSSPPRRRFFITHSLHGDAPRSCRRVRVPFLTT
jgi:hypothetical protein